MIDRYYPDLAVNTVRINNFEASYKAVEYLASKGFKRVSMIAYKTSLPHMMERKEGFLEALRAFSKFIPAKEVLWKAAMKILKKMLKES